MLTIAPLFIALIFLTPPGIELAGVSDELINGLPLSGPQCLAVNQTRQEFLVADALNDRIVVFDSLGRAVFDFPLGDGRKNPFGIVVDSHDEIFVGAMDIPEIWSFDYNGRYLNSLQLPAGILPGRMLLGSADELYVIDRAGKSIYMIDKTSGESGQVFVLPATSAKPSGLCFDADGNMLIVSYEGIVATSFSSDGNTLYTFGEHGRRLEDFSHPTSAVTDDSGRLWIIDSFRHHLKVFDRNHKFINIIGSRGTGRGEFFFPVDLKFLSSGKFGVLEKGAGRLQVFKVSYDK